MQRIIKRAVMFLGAKSGRSPLIFFVLDERVYEREDVRRRYPGMAGCWYGAPAFFEETQFVVDFLDFCL